MTAFETLQAALRSRRQTWLVSGAAGFIGSNLVEALLRLDQRVIGLDNFATGHRKNLEEVGTLVTGEQWGRFHFIEGDIRRPEDCRSACDGVDYVLHQAALGSVPRSIADPHSANEFNVTGFLNVLIAARDFKVKRFVYASSSAIYGDHPDLPKLEEKTGRPLSPYAATKAFNEVYADVFHRTYGLEPIGLRYFNVFGPRQDPEGAYAAVIPKWIAALLKRLPVQINGDGETSRDFCYIANVIQANLLAATCAEPAAVNQAYNIAVGKRTTLNELFRLIKGRLAQTDPSLNQAEAVYNDFRVGDVRHSLADIGKARRLLGYEPSHQLDEGLDSALDWYEQNVV